VVALAVVSGFGNPGRAASVPLRVRKGGLRLSGEPPRHLLRWARVSDGWWLALVQVTTEAGAYASLEMVQWVSSRAVRMVE